MTTITIHTNDEVHVDGRRIGWASTYNQASTRNREKFPRLSADEGAKKFVFWPMTQDGTRDRYVIIDERLDDLAGGWNEVAILAAIEKASP